MPTSKYFFPGVTLFAYLLVGSGHYVAKATKPDARHAARAFAESLPRKVYRYSIVPGGVTSPDELTAARRNDPVVAAHFADFGKNTRITTLQEDMYVYVSYRKGNQTYWSKKKHKVCKGEVVITDGKNFARARCANRLSRVFRPPALAFDEPSAPEFDYIDPPSIGDVTPSDPPLTSNFYGLPDGGGVPPPPAAAQTGANPGPPAASYLSAGPTPIFPSLLPFAAGASAGVTPPNFISTTPPPPINSVPEPAELPFFLASSVTLLAWGAGRKYSRRQKN